MEPTSSAPSEANLDPASFQPQDVISKDVCIIGGGCSGAYTAIRLQDFDKSVVVSEKQHSLGGHASKFTDPGTGITLDIKVIVFGHLEEVKNSFARFDVALKIVPNSLGPPDYVVFSTGETVAFNSPDQAAAGAALPIYMAELLKYSKLQDGFEVVYPIPDNLLILFGDSVKKHSLDDLVTTVFAICQGYPSLLELSTVHVLRYFKTVLLNTLSRGFFMTERTNVSELYHRVAAKLGDAILFNSSIVCSLPTYEIHHDQDFYGDPSSFDAFRFSRPYEIDKATQAGVLAEPTGNLGTRATDPASCSVSFKSPQMAL